MNLSLLFVLTCLCRYQQTLHRNLTYLAGLADPRADLQNLLPVSVCFMLCICFSFLPSQPPGSSILFQSQRAPPSSQSMTPPPNMATTGSSNVSGIVRRPPHSGTSSASGGLSSSTQPSTMAHWGGPTGMRQQIPGQAGYQMKGYAPGPWLGQSGQPPGPYGGMNSQQAQVRMQMEEQQRRQMLRLHQEQLMQQQQARRMQQQVAQGATPPPGQQQQQGGIPAMGSMYPPQAASGSYMTTQPPMSAAYSQPNTHLPHTMDM